MACKTIKPNTNKICIADLNKRIKIQTKYATASSNPNTAPSTSFVDVAQAWSLVKTKSNFEWVDGVQTQTGFNTDFYIRYNSAIDFERKLWIELDDRRYTVINIENIDKQNNIIKLRASETGDKIIEANNT